MTILTVSANTMTYIGDNTSTTDTYLSEGSPLANFGTATSMLVTDGAASNSNHSIIEFSGLSAIPGGATINSVTIYLWRAGSNTSSMNLDFYQLLRALNETTATWNTYDGTSSWTTAGATGSGTDISATLSATMTMGNASQFYSVSSAQLATDVGNGVTKWLISANSPTGSGASRTITTREGTDGNRPAIVVDYTPGGQFIGTASAPYKVGQNIPSTVIAGPFHISDYLRAAPSNGGALRTNLTGLHAYWYDNVADIGTTPTTTSITATTDSNGLFYLTITGSALISGQTGYLVLYDPTTGYGCAPIALPVKNYFEA